MRKHTFNDLAALNLSTEQIDEIIKAFVTKYGEVAYEFAEDIKKQFELPADNAKPNNRKTHLKTFYLQAHLDGKSTCSSRNRRGER